MSPADTRLLFSPNAQALQCSSRVPVTILALKRSSQSSPAPAAGEAEPTLGLTLSSRFSTIRVTTSWRRITYSFVFPSF